MSDKSYDLYVRIEDEFDKNPYQDFNDRKLLALDHQQLHDILQYWLATGEPPPEMIAVATLYELQKAMAGRDSNLFAKPIHLTKQKVHPLASMLEQNAVLYYKACKSRGWDKTPVKTITDKCKVDKSTVHRWIKKYKTVEFADDLSREELTNILNALESQYPSLRYK